MNWITENKGAGRWDFTKSPDKLSYNDGDEIATSNDFTWNNDHTGVPVTETHKPSGYWWSVPVVPPALSLGATDDTIDHLTPATMTVNGGALPITWSSYGTGYTVDGDGRSATISAVSGTCGVNFDPYVTVTATDASGTSTSKTIRNTAGKWTTISGAGAGANCVSQSAYQYYYFNSCCRVRYKCCLEYDLGSPPVPSRCNNGVCKSASPCTAIPTGACPDPLSFDISMSNCGIPTNCSTNDGAITEAYFQYWGC